MSNQTPGPETVLRRAISAALKQVRTCVPGQILSYDANTGQADVQPLVMESMPNADGTTTAKQRAIAPHCPVLFIGGGGSRLTFPVKNGDACLLLLADASLDRWSALGGLVDPQDDRHHHSTDGIAIVGLESSADFAPAHATATVLEGSDIRLGDASGGALATKADIDALALWMRTHLHLGVTTGGGTSGGPSTVPPGASGTTKVKAT